MKLKKMIYFFILLSVLLSAVTFKCFAAENETDEIIGKYADDIFSSLDDDTKKILSEFVSDKYDSDTIFGLEMSDILTALKNEFSFQIGENIKSFYKILAMILIMVIVNSVSMKNDNEMLNDIFSMIVVVIVSVMISDAAKQLALVMSVMEKFLLSFTPVLTVILSLSGNVTFSSFYSSMMVAFCQVTSVIADNILMPFIGVYFGLIIAMNFNELTDVDRISSTVNNAISTVLGIVSTLFTLLLSAKNILSRDIDGVLYNSGKYVISSFVPVVGGAVSGVLSSVIGSLSIVKSTMGIFVIIAALCICLPLFVKVIFCRLSLGALAFLCDAFGEKKTTKLIRSLSKSMRLLSVLAFFELITVIISTGIVVSVRGGNI